MSNTEGRKGPLFPKDATDAERTRWSNAISNMRILADAADNTVTTILGNAEFCRHKKNSVIIGADDKAENIYFLVDGIVRVFQEKEDSQYTAKLLTAPTHFGELSLLAGFDTYRSSIEALTPAVTAAIPFQLLSSLLANDPKLTRAWLYSVARQFSVTIDFLKQSVFGGVAAQLSNVLLSYARAFGRDLPDGFVLIEYELSYSDLAREAACTRRAAIMAMQAFTEQGVVKRLDTGWAIQCAPLEAGLLPGRLSLTHSLGDNRELDEH